MSDIWELFSAKPDFRRIFMEASFTELQNNIEEILLALERNEEVTLLHRGKVKGVIVPAGTDRRVADHPFFGMKRDDGRTADDIMDELRGGRFNDL
jgi:hypothetical protein